MDFTGAAFHHTIALLFTALIFLLVLSALVGVTLALIAKFFHTKTDPKVEKVQELLAHAHCGACGLPGASSMRKRL
jgi:Na+-translocating ferredoxin:NAD+ oxidoreductase subunit B